MPRIPVRGRRAIAAALLAGALAGCAAPLPTTDPARLTGPKPGLLRGYLEPKALVDTVALLPPPPQPGSAAQAADEAAIRAALAAKDSARWRIAILDAEQRDPEKAFANMSCALGTSITAKGTPHAMMLLRRSLTDIDTATEQVKHHYKRTRPFAVLGTPHCTPAGTHVDPEVSYPSGHASIGWGLALVMIELAPDRASAIAARAREFTQSRVACGVHWPSDVAAGRDIGAAVVAQLHANAEFRAQLVEAKREVAAARASGVKPTLDCALEAQALAR